MCFGMEMHLFLFLCLGFCIQEGIAQSTSCKENEEFFECGSQCPLTCKNYQEPIFCTKQCTKGCFCKPGYVIGPTGKCILPTECPLGPCRENEVTTNCVNPCNTCELRGKCYYEYCNRGCDCKPGFFKNSTGYCVPQNKCDVQESACPKNEHYVSCVNLCNDCWTKGDCEDLFCHPGCDCLPGHYRNENEECVPENQCKVATGYCGGANEEYSECASSCNDCQHRGNCQHTCEYGCDCKKGYYRDAKGICIPASQCPSACRDNEEYLECGSSCPETCTNHGKPQPCAAHCVKGCFCKKGFVRGPDGICVHSDKCPLVCGVNEEFLACGSPCPLTCTNLTVSSLCPKVCVQGCVCKPGYVRGPTGACILPTECPVVCQEYEEYLECGTGCQGTCNNPTTAACALPCRKGCFCKAGYVRGPDGKCVLPQQCPMVCQENEVFLECGSACQTTCDTVGKSYGLCPKSCTRGCFCKPGYVRGPYGKCIVPAQCPVVCQENEVFMECSSPCQDTCENIGKAVAGCPLTCIKGCFCKPGYIRGPNGKCILPNQCPLVCQGNEVLLSCGSPCQRTCENIGQAVAPCTLPCIKGCFCKPGYVRGPNNLCILPTECPVVCGEYEEFQKCGTACPITCSNRTTIYPCTLPCVEGCFCKPGYIRGPNGKCILPTSCPVVCGEYEEYQKCGTACPVTCFNRTTTYPCTLSCVEGCFCKPGFIRGPDGKCILPTSCPVVCRENEQFFECRSPCQQTCENRNSVINCTYPCLTGCFCKPGFVRDAYGKCIDPRFCPTGPCTMENEIYNPCGPACIKTCARLEFRQQCPQRCVRGCFCREGFVRDILSNCIRFENCPREPQMCPTGESFYACKPTCRHTCDTLDFQGPCDDLCRPGCACRGGLVRDTTTNRCVPPRHCPSMLIGRRSGDDPDDDVSTTLDANVVTTVSLPISNEDEPQNATKGVKTTVGITSKVTTPDAGTQKPAITTTPSSATTSGKVQTQTESSKVKKPVTTLKAETVKETVALPTVITTKTPRTTLNAPIITTSSPAITNPVTIGKTGQEATKSTETIPSNTIKTTSSKPIETTPSKPIETTPSKPIVATAAKEPVATTAKTPVVTTVKPVGTTSAKPKETTMAKTITVTKQPL